MLGSWKRKLLLFFAGVIVYLALSTSSILSTDSFFRIDNPQFSMTPDACYFLADISYMTFRYDLARQLFERNITDFPYNSGRIDAEYRRALCYEKLGDYSRAIQLFEDFLLDHPKDRRYESVRDRLAKLRVIKNAAQARDS